MQQMPVEFPTRHTESTGSHRVVTLSTKPLEVDQIFEHELHRPGRGRLEITGM